MYDCKTLNELPLDIVGEVLKTRKNIRNNLDVSWESYVRSIYVLCLRGYDITTWLTSNYNTHIAQYLT